MLQGAARALVIAAAIGAALNGGVFFAFSSFVMGGLQRLPASQAIAAMQAINREAPTPIFMSALFGTAALSVGAIVVGTRSLRTPSSPYLIAGGVLYLLAIVLTATYHVPRNNALALVEPNAVDAAAIWARYFREWTTWNHARTATSVAGAVAFVVALLTE